MEVRVSEWGLWRSREKDNIWGRETSLTAVAITQARKGMGLTNVMTVGRNAKACV